MAWLRDDRVRMFIGVRWEGCCGRWGLSRLLGIAGGLMLNEIVEMLGDLV